MVSIWAWCPHSHQQHPRHVDTRGRRYSSTSNQRWCGQGWEHHGPGADTGIRPGIAPYTVQVTGQRFSHEFLNVLGHLGGLDDNTVTWGEMERMSEQ